MKLEDKIYASIGLTVFLTIAYYYAYSFVELYISKLCDKYVCFEFPPYADFFAIWVAIVGLYFVVTSLDAWKNQYKFEEAVQTIKLFNKQLPIMQLVISHVHKLTNNSKKHNYADMFGAEQDFEDMFKIQDIYNRLDELGDSIRNNKNNLHQEQFESLYAEFYGAISDIRQTIISAGLSEANYTEDQEYNIKVKKAKLEQVEEGLKILRKRNENFVYKYNKLKSKLEL